MASGAHVFDGTEGQAGCNDTLHPVRAALAAAARSVSVSVCGAATETESQSNINRPHFIRPYNSSRDRLLHVSALCSVAAARRRRARPAWRRRRAAGASTARAFSVLKNAPSAGAAPTPTGASAATSWQCAGLRFFSGGSPPAGAAGHRQVHFRTAPTICIQLYLRALGPYSR